MPLTGAQRTAVAQLAQGAARYMSQATGDYYDPTWANLEAWERAEWEDMVSAVDTGGASTSAALHAWWRARRTGTGDAGVDDAGEGWTAGGQRDLELKTDPNLKHHRRLGVREQHYWSLVHAAITQGITIAGA